MTRRSSSGRKAFASGIVSAVAVAVPALWASHAAFAGILESSRGARRSPKTVSCAEGFGDQAPPPPTPPTKEEKAQALKDAFSFDAAKDMLKREGYVEKKTEKVEEPVVKLRGPIRPPDAPASYRALTKLRLRNAPSRFAELSTVEIPQDTEFRALKAVRDKEVEDLTYLKTTEEWGEGWVINMGVAGKWANKKTIKRVAGTLAKTGPGRPSRAMHKLSLMDKADVVDEEAEAKEREEQLKRAEERAAAFPNAESGGGAKNQYAPELLAVLEDPKILEMCQTMGISLEDLKAKPEFLTAVSRRIQGEEVVG
eukprot:TRINITY_DN26105_c0_g1_i1.p1 TRINITY_DN26105_c0_g1~~TRINITY_DN26105_c0_g1_i1.p1  ORF type:complete len:311 (-),score=85.08 TRINITY_DN26105_c0_g1_i1:35-967(-)